MADERLRVFRDPGSVAVVGASADQSKWGYWLASGALRGSHRRRVELVNRRTGSLFNRPCVARLGALAQPPELVALCVPPAAVAAVVDEGLSLGVQGFLGITSAVPEERQLARRITDAGARLLGANSLGIYDATSELQLAWGHFRAGPMAVVSQSGQLGSELAILGARHGLGISRFVSIGNQSDVSATELLADLLDHKPTRLVALYLEGFTDGAALFDTLAALRAAGKPTLLLTIGAGAASSRLARTHTGSMTSTMDVLDAACRRAGVLRCTSPGELIDVARAYLATGAPTGSRVAVIGDSGGQGGVAADQAGTRGLTVPPFADAHAERLANALPAGAATTNPVDLAGAGEQDLDNYAVVAEQCLAETTVDAVILTGYFGRYGADIPGLADHELHVADRLGEIARAHGKPLLVHSMAEPGRSTEALWRAGIPTYDDIRAATSALAGLTALRPPEPVVTPQLPAPVNFGPGYWAAREVLAAQGVPFPPAFLVRDRAELAAAARELRGQFVLKAGWLAHKSESGGVVLGIEDEASALAAFDAMHADLGHGQYVLEQQDVRPDTVELLVGVRRDPGFGPVVVVGTGGTEAELHADLTTELAPVDPRTAQEMLNRLRGSALLHGWRGRPAVDGAALTELIVAVSRFATANPHITELELNPVRVGVVGVLAVDVLITQEEES